ncbi:MAG TPA: LpxL/LpxP family Kdo(2)-lipid IV(A) lauroyl/palmitoleoyl acyltransferase [Gammaproteobacteria bacterium]|nr:LpxL/LpxP family Kdo(2)-lipid IV(A) lauroyl/palmitoleoyl acyltransferase [Gammaproteobacteria bacterium]
MDYLGPRHWPTWLGLGLLRLCSNLPLPALRIIGNILGTLIYYLPTSQRRIATINIRLCFPELTPAEQRQRTRASLRATIVGLFESALAWWGSHERLQKLHRIEGLEYLRAAQKTGKGILLLGGHYTTLELGGRLISLYLNGTGIYKPAHNKLFEAVMAHARRKIFVDLIPSKSMRKIIRTLKQGKTCWYAPDQDFGRQGTVFAPFMGVPAASLTITARLAQLSDAVVLPFSSRRLPGNQGYVISLQAPLDNFPSGDDLADATRVNQVIENSIRRAPEQYLWLHRRFKTRPFGEPQLYPLRRDRRLKRYSRLLFALTLPAIAYTGWMAWRFQDKQYLLQRLGLSFKHQARRPIWVHAASVGEVNAVLPLIKLMLEKNPELSIQLTTTTPSGQITARTKMPAAVNCNYLPLDWWQAVTHFLRCIKPSCALIVETEIWPNLYEACFQAGVPLTVINGRLSSRTLNTRPWIRALYCKAMENTHAVLARSEEDARGFVSLSVAEERIRVIGNIKFSRLTEKTIAPITLQRPYVLAASTREGEEKTIARQWLKQDKNNHLLVIVPRHPKRLNDILRDLSSLTSQITIRSKNEAITPETEIYIADTFGELPAFIAGSTFVIMGGAFAEKGGQNILEVAQQGRAVIFGKHMHNFRDEAKLFLQQQAGVCVEHENELGKLIQEWLSDEEKPRRLGENGLALSRKNSAIAQRYLQEISTLYPELFTS